MRPLSAASRLHPISLLGRLLFRALVFFAVLALCCAAIVLPLPLWIASAMTAAGGAVGITVVQGGVG